MIFNSTSEKETEEIGFQIGQAVPSGSLITLYGDLGMGKTALTRGIARGLGVRQMVTSPTFAIVNEYRDGRIPLFHFDLYRLNSADDLYDIGWDDYLESGGICVTEWTENCEQAMSSDRIRIYLSKGVCENERIINIEGLEI